MEYAILGGGALGLMAAYRLAQAGHAVMVFEQEKIPGGLAAGFRVGDDGEAWRERFYHDVFRTDNCASRLPCHGSGRVFMIAPPTWATCVGASSWFTSDW